MRSDAIRINSIEIVWFGLDGLFASCNNVARVIVQIERVEKQRLR
jgi:hypothetical protein